MEKNLIQKNYAALKKAFTWKKVAIAVAIIAITAVIAVPRHINKSHIEATQLLLQQIALCQMAMQTECMGPKDEYVFTDGIGETAEVAAGKMARYGFRPDPAVAFHIMRPPAIDGVAPKGFIAFGAHNSVGSTLYVYDNIGGRGVTEVRENDVYGGGFKVTSSAFDLYCYTFDSSNKESPIKKTSIPIQFVTDPKDKTSARMVVTATAKD